MPLTLDIEGGTTITGSKFVHSPIVNEEFGFGHDVVKNNTSAATGTALTLTDVPISSWSTTASPTTTSACCSRTRQVAPSPATPSATTAHAGVYFNGAGGVISGHLPISVIVSGNTAKFNGTHPDGTLDPAGLPVVAALYLYTPVGGNTITNNKTAPQWRLRHLCPAAPTTFSVQRLDRDFARCYPPESVHVQIARRDHHAPPIIGTAVGSARSTDSR